MRLRKSGIICLLAMFVSLQTSAQIIMDQKGEISTIRKRQPRNGKSYPIIIKTNEDFDGARLREIETAIRTADTLLTEDGYTHQDTLLFIRFATLHNFLRSTKKLCFEDYVETLKKEYGVYTDTERVTTLINTFKIQDQPLKYSCEESCLCEISKEKLAELVNLNKQITNSFLKIQFIRNLFCNEDSTAKLFDIEVKNGNIVFSEKEEFLPDTIPFTFQYNANDKDIPYKRSRWFNEGSIYKGSYKPNKKFALTIQSVDRLKTVLLNLHNKTAPLLDNQKLYSISQWIKNDANIDIAASILRRGYVFDTDIPLQARIDSLNKIDKTLSCYDSLMCATSPIGQYLRNWFWISSGEFSLNYTGFTNSSSLKDKEKEYENNQKQEKRINEVISKIESIVNCITCQKNLSLDTLRWMQDSLTSRRDELSIIQQKMKELKKDIDKNQKASQAFTVNIQQLQSISLPLLRKNKGQSVVYHDASADLELLHVRKKSVFPDNHDIYLGVVNASAAEGEFTITHKQETFNDTAPFNQELGNAIKPLAEAAAILAPLVLKANPFTSSIIGAFGAETVGSLESAADPIIAKQQQTLKYLIDSIRYRLWKIDLLRKLVNDYLNLPTPPVQKPATSATSNYYTYAPKADKWAAPYTNNYTISKDKKVITNNSYSVGRQKTLALAAGLFFNAKSARQQTVDTAGNTFTVKNTDNKARFVIGLKVYPFKSLDAESSIIPRYPLKRLHLFGGFDVTDPLQNLYAGLGYDIVPGLQISCGAHIYRKNYYKLLNNQVVDKTSSYDVSGLYYGVAIDPLVLADIIKTLFK